jgi:hypothetical protein
MQALAERSGSGQLSSFSGVFQVSAISIKEEASLENILRKFKGTDVDISSDLEHLKKLTSEVKAINNQAAMLHGERIKQAQELLKDYKEGAFSAWLLETYGNRQTPYNFMLYYDFYSAIDDRLKEIVDEMPKQVIYTLSSRKVPQKEKEEFLDSYKGETKQELLNLLRQAFPLDKNDKRSSCSVEHALSTLRALAKEMHGSDLKATDAQKAEIHLLLQQLERSL